MAGCLLSRGKAGLASRHAQSNASVPKAGGQENSQIHATIRNSESRKPVRGLFVLSCVLTKKTSAGTKTGDHKWEAFQGQTRRDALLNPSGRVPGNSCIFGTWFSSHPNTFLPRSRSIRACRSLRSPRNHLATNANEM